MFTLLGANPYVGCGQQLSPLQPAIPQDGQPNDVPSHDCQVGPWLATGAVVIMIRQENVTHRNRSRRNGQFRCRVRAVAGIALTMVLSIWAEFLWV